ncbi:MAG: hydrogenase maturation nickel metallochaperone HypA [Oceanospirillaceae bacterium]|nr:hydrogenase maturation nickel metallochaperone HypA [Oceanospirillaceae bacterium]
MHELSLCRSLVTTLEQEAVTRGLTRIVRIDLGIGCLSCVEPEALRFAFDAVAKPQSLARCELAIRRVPGQARCHGCGRHYEVHRWLDVCPGCGGDSRDLEGGDEIMIEQMEAC